VPPPGEIIPGACCRSIERHHQSAARRTLPAADGLRQESAILERHRCQLQHRLETAALSTAARSLARALKNAGVEAVFTLSGGHIMPLYDGCIDEGIKIVDVRHEQAAVHAADAWARCNPGKIGVAAITAGPGVTDGVTGIANAWRANSPILVFGGQGPFRTCAAARSRRWTTSA
jgi:hypothetical protein